MPQTFQGRTRTCRVHQDLPHRVRGHQLLIHTTLGREQGTSCPASCRRPVDHKVSGGDLEDLDLSPLPVREAEADARSLWPWRQMSSRRT